MVITAGAGDPLLLLVFAGDLLTYIHRHTTILLKLLFPRSELGTREYITTFNRC